MAEEGSDVPITVDDAVILYQKLPKSLKNNV